MVVRYGVEPWDLFQAQHHYRTDWPDVMMQWNDRHQRWERRPGYSIPLLYEPIPDDRQWLPRP